MDGFYRPRTGLDARTHSSHELDQTRRIIGHDRCARVMNRGHTALCLGICGLLYRHPKEFTDALGSVPLCRGAVCAPARRGARHDNTKMRVWHAASTSASGDAARGPQRRAVE